MRRFTIIARGRVSRAVVAGAVLLGVVASAPGTSRAAEAQVTAPEAVVRSAPFDVAPELARVHAGDVLPADDQPAGEWSRVQLRFGKRLEAQLFAGIRGIRDQLAQEYLLMRVQRMNHQAQHLLGFGLELFYLRLCFSGHGLTITVVFEL